MQGVKSGPHCRVCASRKFRADHWSKNQKGIIICEETFASELHRQNMKNGIGKICGYCMFIGRPMAEAITHFERSARYKGTCICPKMLAEEIRELEEVEMRREETRHFRAMTAIYVKELKTREEEDQREAWMKGYKLSQKPKYTLSDTDFPALGAAKVVAVKKEEEPVPEEKKRPDLVAPVEPIFEENPFGQMSIKLYFAHEAKKRSDALRKRAEQFQDDEDDFW